MRLEKLHLLNFKNYEEASLSFSPRINVLVGKNGSGKTNLLDAIFYLSFTKSAFSQSDQHCILHEQTNFMIKGGFRIGSVLNEIAAGVQTGSKKIFREGSYDYPKLSEHIGKYPVILIAPDDVDLVKDGSEGRRRFFDSIISQLDSRYLEDLIQYNHVLKQRNSLLKMSYERGSVDWLAIESYDELLVKFGKAIFKKRKEFVDEFITVFRTFYEFIVDKDESTDLAYMSELNEKDFTEGLINTRQKDLALQRTSFGIHRDDYYFTLGGSDIKRLGSQGQQKSFVIALKLAQFQILKAHKGFKPILLLDDIFDKLDDFRIARLLELIKKDLGQLFITDARPDRTKGLLDQIQAEASIFTIENGKISGYEQ
jgi:DNA replication and repair protein RecF